MGYAQAKLVAEHLVARAREAAGADADAEFRVLRVGQIVGDARHGVWNASEAVPLMLRSAVSVGALPELEGEEVRWLPVDVVARACVEIGVGGVAPAGVYNVVNPHALSWAEGVLPLLRECGGLGDFEVVGVGEWLGRLRGGDPERDPEVKLVGFWEGKYGGKGKRRVVGWETGRAREWSRALAEVEAPGRELVGKIVRYFVDEAWKAE